MSEQYNLDLISIPKTSQITDDFALAADRRKAYQIFFLSGIFGAGLTILMYILSQIQL